MILENFTIDDNTFICSYVGTVGMAHGLDVVLRAAQRLKEYNTTDILFLIVGEGASRQSLQEKAKLLGLTNVRFTGILPKRKIPEILSVSGASLIHLKKNPLFKTVIPSKLFELIAMEVPIIMGVEGEAREIMMSCGAGEVMEPENEQDLLCAISTIQTKGRRCYHGREHMMKRFDRNKLADNMLNIIISTTKQKA
jgi:glycosyltransferase involved in cell wall biosynthesis